MKRIAASLSDLLSPPSPPDRTGRPGILTLIALLLGTVIQGAEPPVDAGQLPRTAPVPPWQAISTFEVRSGFRLELAAAEPMVADPVAMAFDENGRLFVVEMRGYSERRPEKLGRIRLLEDLDGDGRFDRSTVYLDQLMWPTAVICYDGGIFIGETPDILFCRDTDGDGVADERKTVFTGFAIDYAPYQTNRLNVQALLNSFNWGLDNRIHGATSSAGGRVKRVGMPDDSALLLRGRDFSFDPRTLEMRAENGGGQHGMSFDSAGRKFVCSNSSHCRAVMQDYHYGGLNPHYALPGGSVNIAVDGDSAEVFRISPDEPWRVIRTRWRVDGLVPGPVEGGGRASGYFTGATGITAYRGDAWPAEFGGDLFIADCGSNLIHRKQPRFEGASLKAARAAGEQKREFLASRDNWFRPVQFANAPDGTLYIADMYREVIEHPWSLPGNIKRHLDLNSGHDRGRIYRLISDDHIQRPPPKLGGASTEQLWEALDHPNGWHRETASRLLLTRPGPDAGQRLRQILGTASAPGRLHALHLLSSLGLLRPEALLTAMTDADATVRRHALKLLEKLEPGMTGTEKDEAWRRMAILADDPSSEVRHQLALSIGMIRHPSRATLLHRLLVQDGGDPWIRIALLNSVGDDAAGLLLDLLGADAGIPPGLLRDIARFAGAGNGDPRAVLQRVTQSGNLLKTGPALLGLAEGLKQSGGSLAALTPGLDLQPLFSACRTVAQSENAPASERIEAIQLLSLVGYETAGSTLEPLLNARHPDTVQAAALETLFGFGETVVEEGILSLWGELTPAIRAQAVARLIARTSGATALLTAIGNGTLRVSELSSTQVSFLREHKQPSVRDRATSLFGSKESGDKQALIESLRPALSLKGDAEAGRRIFMERCASCHQLAGEGHPLGPDLTTARAGGKETILVNLLDPNREVGPGYLSYEVETRGGETRLGIISGETAGSLIVRQAGGVATTVFRRDIVRLRSQRQSMMSEGLEAGLSHQDIANLLEHVMTGRPGR